MKRFIIGIDPDVEKSGFCLLDREARHLIECEALPFAALSERLRSEWRDDVVVVLEDSDVSVNWHYSKGDRPGAIAAIGRSVGMCHATFRHLKEVSEEYGLEAVAMKPLLKVWGGKDRKITHAELAQFVPGLPTRTNPEQRDAVLLAWTYAGLPIRVKL